MRDPRNEVGSILKVYMTDFLFFFLIECTHCPDNNCNFFFAFDKKIFFPWFLAMESGSQDGFVVINCAFHLCDTGSIHRDRIHVG